MAGWIARFRNWRRGPKPQAVVSVDELANYKKVRAELHTYSKRRLIRVCLGLMNQLSLHELAARAK